MSTQQERVTRLAIIMQEFCKILDINQVPANLVRQLAYRLRLKLDQKSPEADLKSALATIKITVEQKYVFADKDTIPFDVHKSGTSGGVPVPPSFIFKANTYSFSELNKDFFTMVEKFIYRVLDITTSPDIRVQTGFQFMHDTVKDFLSYFEKVDSGFRGTIPEHNYFKRVCNDARSKILGTDSGVNIENIKKYQNYLKKEEALIPFSTIRELDLKDATELFEIPFFADKAIAIIQQKGFTFEESVAIYHTHFGCNYQPVMGQGETIVCAICHSANSFFNGTNKTENCSKCGQSLFRKCYGGCKDTFPRIADVCPFCGFSDGELKHFDYVAKTAKKFTENGNIEKAEECLIFLKTAVPNYSELSSIQNNINKFKAEQNQSSVEIDTLILKKFFYEAERKLNIAKKTLPQLTVSSYILRITNAINEADKVYANAGNSIEQMQKVLSICADHAGAKQSIDIIPPKVPGVVGTPLITTDNHIKISWGASRDINVKYRVIRKKGNAPVSLSDSDSTLIAETDKLEVIDKNPIAGVIYYAVFAKRGSLFSMECSTNFIKYLPPVSVFNIKPLIKENNVLLTYNIPQGASSITVTRQVNGGKVEELYNGMKPTYTDMKPQQKCIYAVKVKYDKLESEEKKLTLDLSALPKRIEPLIHNSSDANDITISWVNTQTCFSVKVIELLKTDVVIDDTIIYREEEIELKGREICNVPCEDKSANFRILDNKKYNLAVFIGDKNGFLLCGVLQASAEKFPAFLPKALHVDIRGTHSFQLKEYPQQDDIKYCIVKHNRQPDDSEYRHGIITYDLGKNPMLEISNTNYEYIGWYNIFCKFKSSDGDWGMPVHSGIHFRQVIISSINGLTMQDNQTLNAVLKVEFGEAHGRILYDFEGYPKLPPLCLIIDGVRYSVPDIFVFANKPSFRTTPIAIRLHTPISAVPKALLTSDNTFCDGLFDQDFRINNN